MTKVLHLLASRIYSGAENVVCTIIENFTDEFDMAYCSPIGSIQNILEKNNINYYGIEKLSIKNINKVLKEYKPDIIHAHDYKASVMAALSGFNGKIISQIHNNCYSAKSWNIKTILYGLTATRYYRVIGVSDSIYEEAIFKRKLKNKYITIPNYVDSEKIIEKSNEYVFEKKYDAFYIGRLVQEKNPTKYIEIVRILTTINKDIKTVMIGDGDLYTTCAELIKKYNLENNIEMLGFVENPFPIIKNCKVGIMPSEWEGFGLTAIESMVLNKPVLNSGAGGLRKIFKNNQELICNDINDYVVKYEKVINTETNYYNKMIREFIDKDAWKSKINKIYK